MNGKVELERLLERLHSLQSYIEAKNAALITFIVAAFAVSYELFNVDFKKWWAIVFVISFIVALLVALWSFVPVTRLKKCKIQSNPYYFGDISKMSASEYIELVNNKSNDDLEKDLVNQIIINSSIVNRKINLFRFAIRFMFILTLGLYINDIINSIRKK
mgnify:CR=1 FL=1